MIKFNKKENILLFFFLS